VALAGGIASAKSAVKAPALDICCAKSPEGGRAMSRAGRRRGAIARAGCADRGDKHSSMCQDHQYADTLYHYLCCTYSHRATSYIAFLRLLRAR